eukprot:7136331-Prymnesium_polylepis.1
MPLDSRHKQRSAVLDPARFGQRSIGRCATLQRASGGRAAGLVHLTAFDVAFRDDDSSSRTPSLHNVMK